MNYHVESYSSTRYAERPTALFIEEERLEISEIIKSWRSPEGIVFHVRTEDDQSFEIMYDEDSDQWNVRVI
jgi:hypothetical protein